MEATNKDITLDDMLKSFTGKNRHQVVHEGRFMFCDSTGNIATSFSDDISRKEYAISGMCQSCQDDFFGPGDPDDDEPDWPDDEPDDPYSDVEADADTLASAGMGTDEDYGYF